MTIEEACHSILGGKLAHAIIGSMGVHWAVVAAMARAQTDDDPIAIKALRDYNKMPRTLPCGCRTDGSALCEAHAPREAGT